MTSRRAFNTALGGSLASRAFGQAAADRPNILWITCEDTGPQLGCYGDPYAETPTLDKLAARGLRYLHAWSNAPVCAPARTTIISGMYPTATGAEHMRSMTSLPPNMLMYPCYLREAGYYCVNNNKEDYNLEYTGQVWDESSPRAHWRKRAAGQPFFAIFNFITTHESQIRKRPHTLRHDPAKVRIPAYHPDTPESRHDWAQYYDNITFMDGQAAKVLAELEQDGLADSTIVMFYGDHGSGMPRSKRWPYNSGLHVPMLLHVPEKYRHLAPPEYRAGGTSDRKVAFVDLAPTLLSLAGVKPPAHFHGRAFAGRHTAPERQYNFGFRGRMDERYDCVRSCTDGRYVYLRHFMPHRIYGQYIAYMFETPTTAVWKKMYDEGKLNQAQKRFWEEKPAEELYDLNAGRDEVDNLAASPEHRATLERMRGALLGWMREIRDIGLLPENEIHARANGAAPHSMRLPFEAILETADLASNRRPEAARTLGQRLTHADSAVRYWAATGFIIRGEAACQPFLPALRRMLNDAAPAPRIAAAEALARYGAPADTQPALDTLLALADAAKNGAYVSLQALNALAAAGAKAKPILDRLAAVPLEDPKAPRRAAGYGRNVVKKL